MQYWLKLNSVIRVHMNYVETLAQNLFLLTVGGLFVPRTAAALGALIIVGRELYGRGYTSKQRGPEGRYDGSIIAVGMVGLIACTLLGGLGYAGIIPQLPAL